MIGAYRRARQKRLALQERGKRKPRRAKLPRKVVERHRAWLAREQARQVRLEAEAAMLRWCRQARGAFPSPAGIRRIMDGVRVPGQIHVVLLAWRRIAYVQRTVESFLAHNEPDKFKLWYALDGPPDQEIAQLLDEAGFECLFQHDENEGINRTFENLTTYIAMIAAPEDLLLVLESDWLSLRPLPLELIRAAFARGDVGWVWLFGRQLEKKAREGVVKREPEIDYARPKSKRTWYPIDWLPERVAGEDLLIGHGSWGHRPRILPARLAVHCAAKMRSDTAVHERSSRLRLNAAWPVRNPVFLHIGYETTKKIGGQQ